MKTCPICQSRCFDDMPICFGCMHRFADDDAEACALEGAQADADFQAVADRGDSFGGDVVESRSKDSRASKMSFCVTSDNPVESFEPMEGGAGFDVDDYPSSQVTIGGGEARYQLVISLKPVGQEGEVPVVLGAAHA